MVHELIGINDNKVDLKNVSIGTVPQDPQVAFIGPLNCFVVISTSGFHIVNTNQYNTSTCKGGGVVIRAGCIF